MRAIDEVISLCRASGGKIVYSRQILLENPKAQPVAVAAGLFSKFPATFRFFFFTPHTGGWFGATPETLIDYHRPSQQFSTMALAGTRQLSAQGHTEPWDEKNIRENTYVSDYIATQLHRLGIKADVSSPVTLEYGKIEHLCRPITGAFPPRLLPQVIDALNPTPALCGVPLDRAVDAIARLEPHHRGCYGGALRVNLPLSDSGGGCRCFVCLRCCRFEGHRFYLYAGGGITAQSDPSSEWDETEDKCATLRSFILAPPQ